MSEIKFHKLSWVQFERDCLELFKKKVKGTHIDRIVSISRGGTVPSRIFSDLLGTIAISHITISSYKDMHKVDKPIVTEEPRTDFKDQTILIIDEVSDTGATFELAVEHLKKHNPKKIYTLSPYIKPKTTFKPDFWIKNIDAWIIFPYDVSETTEGFVKMFGDLEHAKAKLLEVGFEPWEIEAVM
jgi:hypoxanthine phosphoribosyltransferase